MFQFTFGNFFVQPWFANYNQTFHAWLKIYTLNSQSLCKLKSVCKQLICLYSAITKKTTLFRNRNITLQHEILLCENIYVWKVSQTQGTSAYRIICTQNSIVSSSIIHLKSISVWAAQHEILQILKIFMCGKCHRSKVQVCMKQFAHRIQLYY